MKLSTTALAATLAALSMSAVHAAENKLVWQVKKSDGIYGYIIYRSEKRIGPFLRLNPKIVRSRNDEVDAKYEFVDGNVVAGQTYYYFIDAVGANARKQRLSGVMQKTVAADGE